VGGKFDLRLNIGNRPIANKYCKGRMKSTWERVLKGLVLAKREPFGTSVAAVHTATAITAVVLWAICQSTSVSGAGERLTGR